MSFKDQMSLDSVNVFLKVDEFAEEVSYTCDSGQTKLLKALIVREQIDSGSEDRGHILRNQVEMYIANHEEYGITEVTKGKDHVSFPLLIGGEDQDWRVVNILSKDNGMWHLIVER